MNKSIQSQSQQSTIDKILNESLEAIERENQTFRGILLSVCEPVFNKIYSTQSHIYILEILRDTLLPKLMSGQSKVGTDA